ncbi:hypothetical protein C8Q76DRAFT_789707 [Earliella scabrosa]|nr:hypothetical protein C8Q76DRAFT_789707 [Earliella scabrosa]
MAGDDTLYYEVPQNRYVRGQPIPTDRHLPTIYFNNFPLGDAYADTVCALADHAKLAWPKHVKVPQKMAIVFSFPESDVHSHQYTLSGAGGRPPPLKRLTQVIAIELQKILTKAPYIKWRGRVLSLNDLVLVKVEHVSKGSLQPVIAVIDRAATAVLRPYALTLSTWPAGSMMAPLGMDVSQYPDTSYLSSS